MTIDAEIFRMNCAATDRMRKMADRLSDPDLELPLGNGWTPAIAFCHLAFWDARVLRILQTIEQTGAVEVSLLDDCVNDILIPFFAAIPPRESVRLALETAEALDARLEVFPTEKLESLMEKRERWVKRSLHRSEHLEQIRKATGG